MRVTTFAGATLAAVAAALALGSAAFGSGEGIQRATIDVHAHAYAARGLQSLRPGLVTFDVRNTSKVPHGAGFVRLGAHTSPAAVMKVLAKDTIPDKLPFTLLGGVPQLQPGQSWQGTLRLTPGRYLLFDDGDNGKGLQQVFTVHDVAASGAPAPRTAGTVTMTDFAFGLHLPANWNGRGVLRVPNVGKEIHELTFVRFSSPALEHKMAAVLSKGWPQGPPPKGAQIFYAVGGTSPGQTSYVRVDLPAGRYLAICLFPDSKTGKPHTALGMLSTLVVR